MRRWLIGIGLVLALAAGTIVVVPPLLWGDGVDYSRVVSIKTTPEFQDLVLVDDVNQKFRPWLVKTDRLFEAVDTVDRQSKKKRGLLLLE